MLLKLYEVSAEGLQLGEEMLQTTHHSAMEHIPLDESQPMTMDDI